MAYSYTSAFSAESSVSKTTSTPGCHEPHQTQAKSPQSSSPCLDQYLNFSSHTGHALSGTNTNILDQELIPQTSRLSRLPFTQPPITATTTSVAISALQTNSTHNHSGQDVHDFVNSSASLTSSTVPRSFGHLPNPPETDVSISSQPHVLNHPIRRPWTYNQFFSSKDLAAQYGIPQILPPAPKTLTRQQSQSEKSLIQVDFSTLRSNYLSMLSQNPSDNTNMTDSTAPPAMTATAEELFDPVIPPEDDNIAKTIAAMLGMMTSLCPITLTHRHLRSAGPQPDGWDMATPTLVDDYSPWSPDMVHPYLSTPQDSTLDTPLFDYLDETQMLTGPDYGPLFPMLPEWGNAPEPAAQPKPTPELDPSALLTISPSSPVLDSFDPSQLSSAQTSSTLKPTLNRRRPTATGIRKGVTPETLLDETAPTQSRNYVTPSATSRKEVPAVFARKRARSTAFGDEEDQLDDYVLPPNPTEKDLIEQKRRQNTVAARRSRKRKLEHLQSLEKSLEDERQKREVWRERALMMSDMLRGLGQAVPDFSAEM